MAALEKALLLSYITFNLLKWKFLKVKGSVSDSFERECLSNNGVFNGISNFTCTDCVFVCYSYNLKQTDGRWRAVKSRAVFGNRSCLVFCVLAVFVLLHCLSSFCLVSASVPGVLSSGENGVLSAVCSTASASGIIKRASSAHKLLALLKNSSAASAFRTAPELSCGRAAESSASDIPNSLSEKTGSVILRL